MSWDSQNRVIACNFGSTTSTFTYGADGLRRRMVTGGKTVDYLLDGQNVARELTTQNGVTTTTATYLNGPRGPEYRRDQNGVVEWNVFDGLGSVVATVGEDGTVRATRKYDVYGAVRGSTGSSDGRQKFCGSLGHASEDETGLVYMRARYMDPTTGRFVSQDAAKNGGNWFSYCCSDPVNYGDQDGKAPWYQPLQGVRVRAPDAWMMFGAFFAMMAAAAAQQCRNEVEDPTGNYTPRGCMREAVGAAMCAAVCFAMALGGNGLWAAATAVGAYAGLIMGSTEILDMANKADGAAKVALVAVFTYTMACVGAMMLGAELVDN